MESNVRVRRASTVQIGGHGKPYATWPEAGLQAQTWTVENHAQSPTAFLCRDKSWLLAVGFWQLSPRSGLELLQAAISRRLIKLDCTAALRSRAVGSAIRTRQRDDLHTLIILSLPV